MAPQIALDAVTVARWQFGFTAVYHYFFVPLTIGLTLLVAILQTAWVRTDKEHYYRATRFWGKLLVINFAIGLVTGIVQEFQFGMNWSSYSRFVGDVFGAPLAIEGVAAFFIESTSVGLWMFGWGRLGRKTHLMTIWALHVGTLISSYFVLSANSWMQSPTGYTLNPDTGRARLTDAAALLFQPTQVSTFLHVIVAAYTVAAALMAGISCHHLRRGRHQDVMRPSLRLGLVTMLICGLGMVVSGHALAKDMYEKQPLKMAVAEGQWRTQEHAPFTVLGWPDARGRTTYGAVEVPGLLSFLVHNDTGAEVPGIIELQKQARHQHGEGDWTPSVPIAFWNYRSMIALGMVSTVVGALGMWLTRRRDPSGMRWFHSLAVCTMFLPLVANASGWIFAEMGRAPWTVYGLLTMEDSVSRAVPAGSALATLIGFVVLYGVLAVIEVRLMVKAAKAGPADRPEEPRVPCEDSEPQADEDRALVFAY
ncbi:cytochrome ubiquinol oxidase subunit I [Streptomyces sp. NPDC002506]|uniref:cytochrome ubiquinol oxidase subunit I n=1 Tax=Streptomyces sp. NPDC002506 TaxID=3154536 RepID=UPI00333192A9